MGSGGVAGAVTFPAYIQDVHGLIMANSQTNSNDGTFSQSGNVTDPDHNVLELLNSAWTTNPYSGFAFTNPTTELRESKDQFNLYYSAVTTYTEDNYGDYITQALLAVTNPTTSQLPDLAVSLGTSAPSSPQTLFTNFATTTRNEIAKFLSSAQGDVQSDVETLLASAGSTALAETTLTAATTLWKSFISAATSELKKCDFPKEVNVAAIINQAAANAKDNLKSALTIVEDIVSGSIVSDIVTEFEKRRDTTYEAQVGNFAATMADVNAVNSSAFMFGVALIRAEQQKEIANFDAQVSFQVLQQGLSQYIQIHSNQLRVSAQAALANTQAHNALLETSIRLLSSLNSREEITPTQLLQLYTVLFSSELSAYTGLSQAGLGGQNQLYGQNVQRDQVNHGLNLEADRLNKIAKEQRYQQGLRQVVGILTNRTEFEKAATALLTEQNRIKIVARSEFESLDIEDQERDALWDLNVARIGGEILASPAGMSAAVPKNPHPAMQVAGTFMQMGAQGAEMGAQLAMMG